MNRADEKRSAEAYIEGGDIWIRVPIKNLPDAVRGGVDLQAITPAKITNARVFAKELVSALNDEDEQGTTLIHRMFDTAINDAIEAGAEGIEMVEEDEP